MSQSLLERFGIQIPQDLTSAEKLMNYIKDVNIIGMDFGDGEISAAQAYVNFQNEIEMRVLGFSYAGRNERIPNIFLYRSEEGTAHSTFSLKPSANDKPTDIRYCNFKKCPGTDECKSIYVLDDGTTLDKNKKTYEELMKIAFNLAVNFIFEYNTSIRKDKRTIILVGRPSSTVWAAREKEYAKMLQNSLSLPRDVTGKVSVAVQAESWAALASYCNPSLGGGCIQQNQVIVVLDNGSSTFDCTIICRTGLNPGTGDDSYQFGGNILDDSMLQLALDKIREEYPNMELVSRNGHKIAMRDKKEDFYGPDGEGTDDPPVRKFNIWKDKNEDKTSDNRTPYRIDIDEQFMKEAVCQRPTFIRHLNEKTLKAEEIEVGSWLDGCRKIYSNFYQNMQRFFLKTGPDAAHPKVPDKVILSGGVSVMPEVRAVVKEIFGVKPEMAHRPNEVVSNGLAYTLMCELLKLPYIVEVNEKIKEYMTSSIDEICDYICTAGSSQCWDLYAATLKKWSDTPGLFSIDDWYNNFFKPEFNSDLAPIIDMGVKRWYDAEGCKNISQILKDKFDEMFPSFVGEFTYSLPKIQFKKTHLGFKLQTDWYIFFGRMVSHEVMSEIVSNESRPVSRDQAWRKAAYDNFTGLKSTIQNGGSVVLHYYTRGFFNRKIDTIGSVDTEGLYNKFKTAFNDDVMNNIVKDICQQLQEPIKDYVEYITPYFNMSNGK